MSLLSFNEGEEKKNREINHPFEFKTTSIGFVACLSSLDTLRSIFIVIAVCMYMHGIQHARICMTSNLLA